jgi:hypothetical protein
MDLARKLRWSFESGPAVGALFGRLYALISLVAWLSLGVQVRVLIGSRGLLPLTDFMEAVRSAAGVSPGRVPTIFWITQSDAAIMAGVAAGAALSLAALFGVRRRLCFALSTALYLSYVTACGTFLWFQWDNLLIECGFLAVFLPANRAAPLCHFLFRLVLFKLYFESGIAKWQSNLHDWHDGSAMTYYYETAPLPTFLGWHAHNLPIWWHHFESRATLVLELVIPLGIFGPRPARLFAAAAFTLFQIGNAGTANYGFFCYLAAALGVFLLDDRDVEWAGAWIARRLPAPLRRTGSSGPPVRVAHRVERAAAIGGVGLFILLSLADGLLAFTGLSWRPVIGLLELEQPFHIVNTYHLFAAITRERIEPEFQTLADDRDPNDDSAWTAQHLWHKPGDPRRAPDLVAPHQPRVDFRLWFYGLDFRRRQPTYVSTLLERMCEDPAAVQPLFRAPLPAHPRAVRIAYWQYHFTSPAEARATGAWWRRARVATGRAAACPDAR